MFTELRDAMNLESASKHCGKDNNPDYDECTSMIQDIMSEESLTTIWKEKGFDIALLLDRKALSHPDYSGSAIELRNTLKSVKAYTFEEHDLCDPFEEMKRKLENQFYLHLDLVSTQEKLGQIQARVQISGWKSQ